MLNPGRFSQSGVQIRVDESRKNKQMKQRMNECQHWEPGEQGVFQSGVEGFPCHRRGQSETDQVTIEEIPALGGD